MRVCTGTSGSGSSIDASPTRTAHRHRGAEHHTHTCLASTAVLRRDQDMRYGFAQLDLVQQLDLGALDAVHVLAGVGQHLDATTKYQCISIMAGRCPRNSC